MANVILLLLLVTSALVPRLLLAARLQMTSDEGFYIFTGTVYLQNLMNRDFTEKSWGVEYHPPFLMSLYAAAYAVYVAIRVALTGKLSIARIYDEGITRFEGRSTLFVIRLLPVILSSFACVPLYLLTVNLTSSSQVAILATLFYALCPLSIGITSLVILEGGLIFFYLSSLWLLLSAIGSSNSISIIVMSGIVMGLAMSSREGGFFLPLSVLVVSIADTVLRGPLGLESVRYDELLFVWLLAGIATLYASWPFIWRHPVVRMRENFRIVASMIGEKNAGWTYNLREFLVGSPYPLTILGAIGMVCALYLGIASFGYLAVLLFLAVPFVALSRPQIPQRGIHAVFFMFPFLAVLSAVGAIGMSLAVGSLLSIGKYVPLIVISGLALLDLVVLDARAFPYMMQYRDPLGKRFYHWGDGIGQWAEGTEFAMAYIDAHAPPNSEVWIYGMKFPTLYYSNRVNAARTLEGEALFFTRKLETGYGEFDDSRYRSWKNGDLKFSYPYYYPQRTPEELILMLKSREVSYVVVQRWARNDPLVTANSVGKNHYAFLTQISKTITAEHTVVVRGNDLCDIYSARSFLAALDLDGELRPVEVTQPSPSG